MKSRLLILFIFLAKVGVAQRPNIIFVMTDDHDADAISAYNPNLHQTPHLDRLAGEGALFKKAFVANSICAPVRATLLTGQHSHRNGHKNNRQRFDSSSITMPKILRENGYQTAMVGKWHLQSYPTGFDFWKILPGQGLYTDPRFIHMNGDTTTYRGYASDVITDEAFKWLDSRDRGRPFLLHIHHKSPHRNFLPSLEHLRTYAHQIFPEPTTLFEDTAGHGTAWRLQTMSILHDMRLAGDLKVDPDAIAGMKEYPLDSAQVRYYHALFNRMDEEERKEMKKMYAYRARILREEHPQGKDLLKYKYQWYMQDYLACVASVDDNMGRLLDYLDKNGLAENTLVVYVSDQGMYLGENGWFDKRFMYDVSMQTPLIMRWPGKIAPGTTIHTMVQNIDFAPTLLAAAEITPPPFMQGLDILPLATGAMNSLPREFLYYHYYEYPLDHSVLPHLGIRSDRYKLIYFYTVDEWEMYDLEEDPAELRNLVPAGTHDRLFEHLKTELVKTRRAYGDHEKAGVLE